MSARRFSLTLLLSLCALAVGLPTIGAPASAAVTHAYQSRISTIPATGPHGESIPLPGPLGEPDGMAVDEGKLYVADGFEPSRLDTFDAVTGDFVSQFQQPPAQVYDLRQSVAVGHATGETQVFVTGDEHGNEVRGRVVVYGAAGAVIGLWTGADTPSAGGFGCFECNGTQAAVAVDASTNLISKGRVYVSDSAHGVVDVFEALAGGGEKYLSQLSGPAANVPFAQIRDVAVDQQTGDVLVVDGNTVDVFEPQALNEYALVRQLTGAPSGAFEGVRRVSGDDGDGDIYVADEGAHSAIDQFSSTGVYLGHLTGSDTPAGAFGSLAGLAVDAETDGVYVGERTRQGSFVDVFGPGLIIPDVSTEPAANIEARSVTLAGTVNPDGAGAATCRFEWGTTSALGKVAPCEPEGLANGSTPVAVHATLSGLAPDTTYHYRLLARNANGTNPGEAIQDQEFTTPGAGVSNEAAALVTSASATLSAGVDSHGSATTYYFQYGTAVCSASPSACSDLPTPPGLQAPSGAGAQSVSVHIQGLQPATVYHFRVIAINEFATTEGVEESFTTQSSGGEFALPDGRQWEMVTPPNKQGADLIAIGSEQGGAVQAADDGSAMTYGATAPFAVNPAGNRSPEVTQVFSRRTAAGSWATADITTPHDEGATELALGRANEYKLFSPSLSLGLLEPAGDTPLPPLPANAEKTVYLRTSNGEYEALVTTANTQAGAHFGGDGENHGGVEVIGATPDLSHVMIDSQVQLTSQPAPKGGIYEWADGQLRLASILPDGEPTGAKLGNDGDGSDGIIRHAISDDGARLVFTNGHLYLRDMQSGTTVQVDAAQGPPEPAQAGAIYQTANSTDSRVFFTSAARLTEGATVQEAEEDLYEFEVTSANGQPLAGKLTDLSVDRNAGESADVQGVIGASEDGSYVYFVAQGVLGDAAAHGATRGDNLYVERYDEEAKGWAAPTFVAALAAGDAHSWGEVPGVFAKTTDLKLMTARVSPNGQYLAFMSERSLTGYENRDANSGVPDEEVYLYDVGSGKLMCTSCNPTGARPAGMLVKNGYESTLVDYAGNWGERWVAASVPGWGTKDLGSAIYQPRFLSDSGRLFFDSADALVPADVNGKEDVYEYEPEGFGSCQGPSHGQSASSVYEGAIGGCVGLISAGTSTEESAFMDASEDGGDVFFITSAHLSPQDYDTSLDLYDAHECTTAVPCAPPAGLAPPSCSTGDACKPAPAPQPAIFGAPSSETFSGAGNVVPAVAPKPAVSPKSALLSRKLTQALKACRKRSKKRRAVCERRARKRYGASKSRTGSSASTTTGR